MNTAARMDMSNQQQPFRQCHKHNESTDSETSFFEFSSSSSDATDSWSGYFEGWSDQARDTYCPEIASCNSSFTRSRSSETTQSCIDEELLPTAYPERTRPAFVRKQKAEQRGSPAKPKPKRTAKRYGVVPYSDKRAGDEAVLRMNLLLGDAMSSTEDILAAMYNPDWDAASLQKWYQQSARNPADLALFKIMFALRHTADEPSAIPF